MLQEPDPQSDPRILLAITYGTALLLSGLYYYKIQMNPWHRCVSCALDVAMIDMAQFITQSTIDNRARMGCLRLCIHRTKVHPAPRLMRTRGSVSCPPFLTLKHLLPLSIQCPEAPSNANVLMRHKATTGPHTGIAIRTLRSALRQPSSAKP